MLKPFTAIRNTGAGLLLLLLTVLLHGRADALPQPAVVAQKNFVVENSTLTVAAPGVLSGATTNGLTLTAKLVANASHGNATISGNGAYTYTPTSGYSGTDSFTFDATDTNGTVSNVATATIIVDAPPSIVSVTPGSQATYANQVTTFTVTVNAPAGTALLSSVGMNFGNLSSPATSLYAKYQVQSNLLYLTNASGTNIGGFAPGSNNTITTPLGSLNCAQTTVTRNGNQLVIVWSVTPTTSLIGSNSVYPIVSDLYGATSGWQKSASWTVTLAPPISVVNHTSYVLENASVTTGAPGVLANAVTNGFVLTAALVANGGNGNAVVNPNGGFTYTPNSGFVGTDSFTFDATDIYGGVSNVATVAVTVDAPPTIVSASPNPLTSSVTQPASISLTFNTTFGASTLSAVSANFGNLSSPATSLYAKYQANTNLLYLTNSAGATIGGFAPGSNNVITTPLGSLNCAQTIVSTNVDLLTINWSITPSASLLGSNSIYAIASDVYGASSGWQKVDTWTIPSPPANDNFANAVALSGQTGTINGTTLGATSESGEPAHYGPATNSVWYQWTAPSTSPVQFQTTGTPSCIVAVYTGSAVNALTRVYDSDYAEDTAIFNPLSGQIYYIAVDIAGSGDAPGGFTLTWSLAAESSTGLFTPSAQATYDTTTGNGYELTSSDYVLGYQYVYVQYKLASAPDSTYLIFPYGFSVGTPNIITQVNQTIIALQQGATYTIRWVGGPMPGDFTGVSPTATVTMYNAPVAIPVPSFSPVTATSVTTVSPALPAGVTGWQLVLNGGIGNTFESPTVGGNVTINLYGLTSGDLYGAYFVEDWATGSAQGPEGTVTTSSPVPAPSFSPVTATSVTTVSPASPAGVTGWQLVLVDGANHQFESGVVGGNATINLYGLTSSDTYTAYFVEEWSTGSLAGTQGQVTTTAPVPAPNFTNVTSTSVTTESPALPSGVTGWKLFLVDGANNQFESSEVGGNASITITGLTPSDTYTAYFVEIWPTGSVTGTPGQVITDPVTSAYRSAKRS